VSEGRENDPQITSLRSGEEEDMIVGWLLGGGRKTLSGRGRTGLGKNVKNRGRIGPEKRGKKGTLQIEGKNRL